MRGVLDLTVRHRVNTDTDFYKAFECDVGGRPTQIHRA